MVSKRCETKGTCPNDYLHMENRNELRQNLESCPNDEKRVELTNELRLNLDGVPMIGNKMDEV